MLELDPDETIPDGIARVFGELFDDAAARLEQMGSPDPTEVVDAVHQFRKRSKELRSVARLVRPALGDTFVRFNHQVRDASAELAATRDAHVVLQTLDNLAGSAGCAPGVAALREQLTSAADAATRALQHGDRHRAHVGRLLAVARDRAASWQLPDSTTPLAEGLEHTFRRGHRAQRAAEREPTDERLHELRKSVKAVRYQTQLLAAAPTAAITSLVEELDALGDLIGDDHDLAVLIARIERGAVGSDSTEPARVRQRELRVLALQRSARIYAEEPDVFVDRIMTGWTTATQQARSRSTRVDPLSR